MDHKECFGSIKEIQLNMSQTITHTRPECRSCEEIRDCLRVSKQIEEERKEREELRKQELIAQIIDLSHITSNEIGSCLLEFLSRIYNSPLGMILFKNLLLFYEVPQNLLSYHLTIPISRTTLKLIQGEGVEDVKKNIEEFTLRVVLFHKSFPDQPKANMGMIAYEVARMFSSDPQVVDQIFQMLSDSETNQFKQLDLEARTRWIIERWGLLDEFEALNKGKISPL